MEAQVTSQVENCGDNKLSTDQADILAIQNINPKLFAEEPELMRSKWFDYRLLHPVEATYLMVSEYTKAYRKMIATISDRDRAQHVSGVKGDNFMSGRERNSFWKLRQHADALGVRYDYFMAAAMRWCVANGWRQPPRPSQIYSNEEMLGYIIEQWLEECKAKIQYPTHEHYLADNWVGSEAQLAYESWIVERIKQCRIPQYALSSALYDIGVMRIETALENFPQEVVELAIDYCLTCEDSETL